MRIHIQFDTVRILDELKRFSAPQWQTYTFESALGEILPLITVGGHINNIGPRGAMHATPHLDHCGYLRRVLAILKTPLGISYIQRLLPGYSGQVPMMNDYYRQDRAQVLIFFAVPAATRLQTGDATASIAAGDAWLINSGQTYRVSSSAGLTYLVINTVGSSALWQLTGTDAQSPLAVHPTILQDPPPLAFERVNFPVIMSPWELQHCVAQALFSLPVDGDAAARDAVLAACETLRSDWHAVWACCGDSNDGLAAYRGLLVRFNEALAAFEKRLWSRNGSDVTAVLHETIVKSALNPELRPSSASAEPAFVAKQDPESVSRTTFTRFERPVFIVAAPRSGSSLLFETLSRAADVWTLGGEGHAEFEGIPELHPINRNWHSNRVTADDATAKVLMRLQNALTRRLRNRDGQKLPSDGSRFRLLEKTPKNSLRVPFLAKAFPDARFIYLYREPRGNLSSIIEAWRSRRFITYPTLPGWQGEPWSLLLIPGWRELNGAPLEEIAAAQWQTVNNVLLDDLAALPDDQWCMVDYDQFLAAPQQTAEALARFCGLRWDACLETKLPLSRHTLTPPEPDKWRSNAVAIERVLADTATVALRCQTLLRQRTVRIE
ncbi:MAG: sulfotransferase family protein [Gammaproteobacteria bacterium]